MDYEFIRVDKEGEFGIITLNRPDKLNALTDEDVKKLISALQELEQSEGVRVVIIKANGKVFCSGHDFNEILAKKATTEHRMWLGAANFQEVMHKMSKPVIAAVHGYVAAGGISIISACDLVIASEETKFSTPGINFGLACMLPAAEAARWMFKRKALQLLLTGESIDARTAERIGLINEVVSRERLDEVALDMARKIVEKSPFAIKLAKESFYIASDMELNKIMVYLRDVMAINASSEDAREGITSFIEKRSAHWKGC